MLPKVTSAIYGKGNRHSKRMDPCSLQQLDVDFMVFLWCILVKERVFPEEEQAGSQY